ncbi:MAG TPA: hypothetical protein VIM98_15050 [Dyella sp.]|uniref:L,D-transpeptidase family protein n=1 Tax=Dyella sp. TaxID=1869338 RepID=UPI002F9435AE
MRGALLALVLTVAAFATTSATATTPTWTDAHQAVVVITGNWDAIHGSLHRYERDRHAWHAVGKAEPVVVGRNGAAWGKDFASEDADGPVKHEGDNRSPAGIFRIGEAFGYEPKAATALPYRSLQATDYCVDATTSPFYNRIVDTRDVGGQAAKDSTEPMRRDIHVHGDQRYRLGFVIASNPDNTPGLGSCIFAHIWHSPDTPTAGCTAMTLPVMQSLLGWLRPERKPIFVLLPRKVYQARWKAWQLPAPQDTGA